ncbi:MAG: response regulator [Deltaproteobacteria bacterium]|nr:response regulator [Deltaproteobacteria bacterium]
MQASILFVDDDPNVLRALQRCMRKEPHRCFYAEGPEDGLDTLAQEEIDLVVCDHFMPVMDGLSFLKKVKLSFPEVVRILMTGLPELDLAIEAINEGEVYRFLTKPWSDAELRLTLRQLIDYIDLRRDNQRLMHMVHKQRDFIEQLNKEHPQIFDLERDESGAIVLDLDEY